MLQKVLHTGFNNVFQDGARRSKAEQDGCIWHIHRHEVQIYEWFDPFFACPRGSRTLYKHQCREKLPCAHYTCFSSVAGKRACKRRLRPTPYPDKKQEGAALCSSGLRFRERERERERERGRERDRDREREREREKKKTKRETQRDRE